jgi:WD40 repeat protein
VEWKPDGSYAIIVGEKIIKYDGTTFSTLYTPTTQFHGVAWKPDGSYALIVGGGSIWKYDGVSITELYSNISYEASSGVWMQVPLNDVEWNPDGSYALIAGGYGRVYKYDEESLIELKTDTRDFLNDIDWRPDGKYALIVGGSSILRYPSSSFNNTIEATFDIDPNTLNLKSKGRWITCYITLNDPYDVNDIDISTILLEDTIPAEWGDIQGDTLIVKFDRSEVEDMLPVGTYNLKVTGELTDGTSFEGYSDEIKVIDNGVI